MKNILFFVDHLDKGGIQAFLKNIVTNINKEIFKIDILTYDDGKNYDEEISFFQKNGNNVYILKNCWINSFRDFKSISKKFNNFLINTPIKYDIFHINSGPKNYFLAKVARKFGIKKIIYHSHNTNYQTKSKLKKIFGDFLKSKVVKYSSTFLACSKVAGEWMFPKKIQNSKDFHIIYNPINLETFKFDPEKRLKTRAELKFDEKTIVFGNVGRMIQQKNQLFLIDVFNKYLETNPNSVLLIFGDGELHNQIQNKIKSLNLQTKVILMGNISNLDKFYNCLDCLLFPSLYEGLSVVSLEAQANGLPCIFNKNFAKETFINENVFGLESVENVELWVKKMSELTFTRAKISKNMENFSINKIVNELENIYKN